jgi:hypothetical protein
MILAPQRVPQGAKKEVQSQKKEVQATNHALIAVV